MKKILLFGIKLYFKIMSGINHITGGTVFTGIFASFWNINIFSNPLYLGLTILFSVLPDIDHTKSPIGKIFYPIAKYLDIHFGHRTITHSILVYSILWLILGKFTNFEITLIFVFSYFSHLLFDMLTVSGVPLLYPFFRNKCVIPGNHNARLKSGDLQTESVVFVIFLFLGFSCQNLFEQGFWTTYNKQFNTIYHLYAEYKVTNDVLDVNFKAHYLGKDYEGKGTLCYINEQASKAILFIPNERASNLNKKGFFEINTNYSINKLQFIHTKKPFKSEEKQFLNISKDSLTKITREKIILKMNIRTEFSKKDFEFSYNPHPEEFPKEVDTTLNKQEIRNKIELLETELNIIQSKKAQNQREKSILIQRIRSLESSYESAGLYEKESITKKLAELKTDLISFVDFEDNREILIVTQIRQLKEKLSGKKDILYSGTIQYLPL
jgi:inner membrane protein